MILLQVEQVQVNLQHYSSPSSSVTSLPEEYDDNGDYNNNNEFSRHQRSRSRSPYPLDGRLLPVVDQHRYDYKKTMDENFLEEKKNAKKIHEKYNNNKEKK